MSSQLGMDGRWVTMHGARVFIKDGQSVEDATANLRSTPKPASGMTGALKMMADMRDASPRGTMKDYKYKSLEALVLAEGQSFAIGPRPPGVRQGTMKLCYMNAYNLAQSNPDRYVYVEGKATSQVVGDRLPFSHAWVVDRTTGKVVDPTWKDGKEYIGIPLKQSFVEDVVTAKGTYGVLENYEQGLPLLKDGVRHEDRVDLAFSKNVEEDGPTHKEITKMYKEQVGAWVSKYNTHVGDMSVLYLDPDTVRNSSTTAETLHADAKATEPTLRKIIDTAADDTGGSPYYGPGGKFAVKSMESLREKIEKRGKPVDRVADAVRGTVVVKEVRDIYAAVEAVKRHVEESGGTVLRVDDKYAKPAPTGYIGVHVDVMLKTPVGRLLRGEIQVHDHDMSVKEQAELLYQKARVMQNMPTAITRDTLNLYNHFMGNAL